MYHPFHQYQSIVAQCKDLFVKKAKQEDALAGFTAGIFVMITVISLQLVAWTWFTLVGVITTMFVGTLLSKLSSK